MNLDRWWVTVGVLGVVGAALVIFNSNRDGGDRVTQADADRTRYCGSLSGTPAERLDACLGELGQPSLSKEARGIVEDMDGKVLVAGDQLEVKAEQVLLGGQADYKALLLGDDEAAVAKRLREDGFRGFVVHRDLTAALDRDDAVLARLAHHDFLEWFTLRRVTSELMIYTVRPTPSRITESTGDQLLEGLRARLEGRTPPRQTWSPDSVKLIGSIRLQGQTLALRHEAGQGKDVDIERVLDLLADKLERRWEREVEILGIGRLRDRLDEARIEIHVVMERAVVEPRSRFAVFDLWELGVDGAMMTQELDGGEERFGYMPGSEATAHAFKTADAFLQHTAQEGGWRDRRPWEAGDVRLDIIRTEHFMEARPGGGRGVRMMRGMPIVPMDELTDESIRQMLVDGGEWWLRNQHPNGAFVYKYWPDQNRFSTEYNEVRHILGARDLADTWRYRHDPRYLDGARRAMDWLLEFEVDADDTPTANLPHPPPGTTLFRYPFVDTRQKPANQKLGTVAVALLGWLEWAKATGSHAEDERILRMARFVKSMQQDDGRFEPYYVPRGHAYYGQKNDIVPGEAALALGLVAEYFEEPEWLDFFPKFLDYYEPWFRERAVRKNEYGRWPHATYDNQTRLDLVQFGPWSVMASKQYYKMTGDERAAKFGLEVADWMIDSYQWTGDRSPWPDYVGGYYKLPEELPAMQTFCYSEGTAAAYTIAARFSPETKDKYDTSTREAIRFMRVMQYDDVDSYAAPRPDLVHGGIKYAMNEGKIRTDYVGHGLSTLSQYLDARAQDPAVTFDLVPLEVDPTAPVPPKLTDLGPMTPGASGGGYTAEADDDDEGGD